MKYIVTYKRVEYKDIEVEGASAASVYEKVKKEEALQDGDNAEFFVIGVRRAT